MLLKAGIFVFFVALFLHVNPGYFSEEKYADVRVAEKQSFTYTANAGWWTDWKTGMEQLSGGYFFKGAGAQQSKEVAEGEKDFCAPWRIDCWLLYGLWGVMSWILAASGLLMDYMIDPKNFNLVVGQNAAILEIWKGVRDLLNLAFMLVLLFSAFATVFQSSSYHLIKKNILLQVILMALLVNFSFPIARFIIDISNVTGYYFLSQMIPDGKIAGQLAGFSNITQALLPVKGQEDLIAQLFMAIILTGILAVTFLVIGITFVIRLVLLAVLIIFSPIGFVGNIMGGGTLKKYADDWWSSLFKYSFFFPAMALMLYISLRLAESFSRTMQSGFQQQAAQMGGKPILATLAFFSVPIAVIWVGFFAALKIGDGVGGMAKTGMGKIWKGTKTAGKVGYGAVKIVPAVNRATGRMEAKLTHYKDTITGKKGPRVDVHKAAYDEETAVLEARQKAKAAGKDVNEAEKNARQSFKEKKNREDIKGIQDSWDGKDINHILTEMDTLEAKIHNDIRSKGEADLKDMKELAGMRAAAKSKGKEYEEAVKKKSETLVASAPPGSAVHTEFVNKVGSIAPPAFDEVAYRNHMNSAPLPGQEGQWQAQLERYKAEKQAVDEWKKKAKEFHQDKATAHMAEQSEYTDAATRGYNKYRDKATGRVVNNAPGTGKWTGE